MHGHVDDHELILSWDGELPRDRQSYIAQHLESCRMCCERADRLQSAMRSVAALDDGSSPPQSLDYVRLRLASALHDAAAPPWWSTIIAAPGEPWGRGVVVVASAFRRTWVFAAVVIVLCATAFVAGRGTSNPAMVHLAPGVLPHASLTPGAVVPLTAAELCSGVRPSRVVSEAVRVQVVRAYGMQGVDPDAYELDALVTPELGGSTDPANLWPQRYHSPMWNAKVKDELERLLPELVCSNQISLADAQREIATDWVASYKRHFKTDVPLRAHLSGPEEEEEELVFVADEPPALMASIRLGVQ